MKKLLLFPGLLLMPVLAVIAQNPRNVLIYNITSTDCGPCSCMDWVTKHHTCSFNIHSATATLRAPKSRSGSLQSSGSYNVELYTERYSPGSDIVRLTTEKGGFRQRFVVL